MAEYRDELAAARMRIDTLEAKLAERDAALRARDAEIMERDAELDRLRPAAGAKPGAARSFGVITNLLVAAASLGIGVAVGQELEKKNHAPIEVVEPSATNVSPALVEPPQRPIDLLPTGEPRPAHAEGAAKSDGDGAQSSLGAQVERARPDIEAQIRLCYAQERLRNPSVTGFLSVTFDIDRMGSVSRVELGGLLPSSPPWWSDALATCVDKAVRAQRFQPSGDSKTTAKISLHLMRPIGP
jgi:hypothetical protein